MYKLKNSCNHLKSDCTALDSIASCPLIQKMHIQFMEVNPKSRTGL